MKLAGGTLILPSSLVDLGLLGEFRWRDGLGDGKPDLPDLPSLRSLVRTTSQTAEVGVGLQTRFREHPILMGSINRTLLDEGHRRLCRTRVSIFPNLVTMELRVDSPVLTSKRSRR